LYLAFSFIVSIFLFSVSANAQNDCGNFAGTPHVNQIICWEEQALGLAMGKDMADGSKFKFYLHDGNIINAIDSNFLGIFSNNGSYPTNQQLYISVAVGPTVNPGGNSIDLNDPCTDIQQPGTLVTFLDSIAVEHEYTCTDNSVGIEYTVTGGYNNFMSSGYTVSGSTSGTVNAGVNNSFSLSLPSLNNFYLLNVVDENRCNIEIKETYECGKVDLALRKRLADWEQSNLFNPGDSVTFTFEIHNQGDVPIAQVYLIDYIPNGLILNDSDWPQPVAQTVASILNPPPNLSEFMPGGTYFVDITFMVATTVNTSTITNSAEIAYIKFVADGEEIYVDDDSTFDMMTGNNGMPIDDEIEDPSDNDSHDIETITINTCGGIAGTMPIDTIFSCSDASATAIEEGSTPVPGNVTRYVLHTSSTSTIGAIEASNIDGTFTNPNRDCTILYISYVFGPDDGNGNIDLTNDCTIVLPGTPVVWSSPIVINSSHTCTNQMYSVRYDITGGFAVCENSQYMVSGDVMNTDIASPGVEIINGGNFNNNTTYTINVEDNRGCEAEAKKGPIVCENPDICNNEAGAMSNAQIEACANTEISTSQIGSTLDTNDVSVYYLHDSSTGLSNNIIADDPNGIFSDPGIYCTTLYISYVFGPDEDGDGLPDTNNECTKILDGTPVLWVPEVTLSSTAECDTDEDQYLITYTVNGGSASCNSNVTFSVNGTVMDSMVVAGTNNTHPNPKPGGTAYLTTPMLVQEVILQQLKLEQSYKMILLADIIYILIPAMLW